MAEETLIYTLGHSNHSTEHFLKLLKENDIQVVVDVRSRPYSRFVPHFNRAALSVALAEKNIRYLFLGRELGGKPPDQGKTRAGELVMEYLRSRPQFRLGLTRLLELARRARVCVLCAEADPARCHRGQLLAPELAAMGVKVYHILANGSLLEHSYLDRVRKPQQKLLF